MPLEKSWKCLRQLVEQIPTSRGISKNAEVSAHLADLSNENLMEIDCQSVKQKLDSGDEFLFVDCRNQNEYDHVKINGTTLIPMGEFVERLGELDGWQQKEVIVHCHHGGRSLNVVQYLRQQGFSHAVSMAGGIDVWAQEIDPSLARY